MSIEDTFDDHWTEDGETGCWNWGRYKNYDGYGMFSIKGKLVLCHRYTWSRENGEIPEGMHICHKCDNPSCVNPEHLWMGTCKENMEDKVAKGRQANGSQNGNSKLCELDVDVIRYLAGRGHKYADIAEWFGVDRSNVGLIVSRQTWKHAA